MHFWVQFSCLLLSDNCLSSSNFAIFLEGQTDGLPIATAQPCITKNTVSLSNVVRTYVGEFFPQLVATTNATSYHCRLWYRKRY